MTNEQIPDIENKVTGTRMSLTVKVAVFVAVIASVAIVLGVFSYASTGQLTKVFSKTVLPGQTIENNITVRKYYIIPIHYHILPYTKNYTKL